MTGDQVPKEAEDFLRAVFGLLEEDVAIEIEPDGEGGLYVNLVGNAFAVSEERPALAALEHLLRGVLHRRTGQELEVVLDANGAVKRRRAELIGFALSKAEEVVREQKRVRLNAMPAHERRIVHMTLADYPGVKTYSIGAGERRRLVMEPAEGVEAERGPSAADEDPGEASEA